MGSCRGRWAVAVVGGQFIDPRVQGLMWYAPERILL